MRPFYLFRKKSNILGLFLLTILLIQSLMGVVLATTARTNQNYDDISPEIHQRVCDNTFGDMQNLRVTYTMGEGVCLIRGVNYSYISVGSGPHNIDLQFEGDSFIANYSDTGIPYAGTDSWRVFYCQGSIYLLDDDPAVNFIGTQPSTNCIQVGGDTPNTGHSYRDTGSGWILDSYEYLITLIYEWVINLSISEVKSGQITSSDNIDAYYVNLSAGVPYMFILDRVGGGGNLTLRLFHNQELTNNVLATATESSDPEYLAYTPSSDGIYLLLVEAETAGTDVADYNISFTVDNPPISNHPSPITTTSSGTETIGWILTDDFGASHYRVLLNTTPSPWYIWQNNTNLQYPINRSAPGDFNYTIQFNDTGNNWGAPDTVMVTVLDSPPISNHPNDIITAVNSSAVIPWIIIDDYGAGDYRVFINLTPTGWQPWVNNTAINYPINTSQSGIFNYVIQFNDSAGNLGTTDAVQVEVITDTTPPVSNQPANITTTRNGTETINWILIDNVQPGYYRVLVNGAPSAWYPWTNNTNLQYPIDRTIPGYFNYTIQFNDSAGIWGVPNTVFVTVVDNPPIINQPSPIVTSTTGAVAIPWVIIDDYGTGFYRVLVNSTPNAWQSWVNNTVINYPVNTTTPGIFNYTIQYNDSAGQWGAPSTVMVTVLLDAPPTANNPGPIQTYVGYNETINWILTDDLGAGYYRVLVEGIPSAWVPWVNATSINYPIDTTAPGNFNYTIQYNDSAGQWGNPQTVIVTIGIDVPPQSNHPGSITTYVSYTEVIGWILTDDVGAGYYRVLTNGTPSSWTPWTNATPINYPINTAAVGLTNYTIQYNDSGGRWGFPDTVMVTVDIDDPPTSNSPADVYTIRDYVAYIGWILNDDVGAGKYRVLVNDSPSSWQSWTIGNPINYPIDTTNTGPYNYTIEFNDSRGQWGIPDTVFVYVSEPPTLPTGETQINLTCRLNGSLTANQTGFSIPVEGWNSTFLEMSISNVSLFEYLNAIEEDYGTGFGFRYRIDDTKWVMSFELKETCILDAVDFVYSTYVGLLDWGTDTTYTGVFIYNATYSITDGVVKPDQLIYYQNESGLARRSGVIEPFDWVSASTGGYWNGTLTVKPVLDITQTYANYFFIGFNANSSLWWHYINDADDAEGDQGLVYYEGFGPTWYNTSTPTDTTLRLKMVPLTSEKHPSDLNMTINSQPVSGLGIWTSTDLLIPEPSGAITANVSLLWYNVSYSLNWTAHLLKLTSATTSFYAEPQSPIISWNVTAGVVFAANSYLQEINVTIPLTWNTTTVYYTTLVHNSSLWNEIVGNTQRFVIIRNATNGMWTVACDGKNWISNLVVSLSELYVFSTANITATFIDEVYDSRNNTAEIHILDSYQQILETLIGYGMNTTVNLTWNVAESIHTHGIYQLVLTWFNGTEAGIWNTSVRVFNSTSLIIVTPDHRGNTIEMAKGQIFNLTLNFNMAIWNGVLWDTLYLNELLGANVTYTFQGSEPQPMLNTTTYGNWAWTTTITAPNTYGTYPIYINATAGANIQNYTNYLILLKVKQYGTNLIFNDTATTAYWNTSIAFSFTYTNITGYGIQTDNITIEWKYEGDTSYQGFLIEGVNYTITYDSGTKEYTVVFSNLSARKYKLLFHIEADVYQSQDAYLTLIFNNLTTSLTNLTTIPRLVYREAGIFNITLNYKDVIHMIGITTCSLQTNWSNVKDYTIWELGNGYYNLSLNLGQVPLGNYTILISASKMNYESSLLYLPLEIYGYPTNITNIFGTNLTGTYAILYALENWTITFQFINASNGFGIGGAVISATLDSQLCVWQDTGGGNYTVWADTSKLAAPMAEQNYTLLIQLERAYYQTQVLCITINITKLPAAIIPEQAIIPAKIDDFIEVRIQLNDTYNHRGITGIIWYDLNGETQQMLPSTSQGQYYAILNLTGYSPGTYLMNLTSSAIDYQNATYTIVLNITRLEIFIISQTSTFSGYINETITINIQLKDSRNRIIENHGVSYLISPGGITGIFSYVGNGYYNISIDLTGFSIQTYQIAITAQLTAKYNENTSIFNLIIQQIPTIIIPAENQVTGYVGDEYLLSVTFWDSFHNTEIDASDLKYEIPGTLPLNSLTWIGGGTYQATLNLTEIGTGNYTLEIKTGTISNMYQEANVSINLEILTKIQTKLLIKLSASVRVGEILNSTFNLQTLDSNPIPNQLISYSIRVTFYNGSELLLEGSITLNGSGLGGITYMVPLGVNYITIFGNFEGSGNLKGIWNSSLIFVESVAYTLTIAVPSSIRVGEDLRIKASLSNNTHIIPNALINFTIIVTFSAEESSEYFLAGYTNANGTATVLFTVPEGSISIYILASYTSYEGKTTSSNPQTVLSIDPLTDFFAKYGIIFALILGVMILSILLVYTYRKARRRFMSIEERKRELMQKRAQNRREIAMITQEIKEMRAQTLKEADAAIKNLNYSKAAQLYEKAGNLTLELADKTVAREFFLKAKEMQKMADKKAKQKELREQREKLLEKAREAIRERNIIEASRNYRQVAEISRLLGEREQADKFLKLANAAHERIEALKEGDLRKKSGVFLSKADKAMGKQNFLEAAKNFEEAAKIMLMLEDDEGVNRFTGWAKLARERDALAKQKSKEEWENELINQQKKLIQKAKLLLREKNFEGAADIYSQLTIYALELGNLASVKKFKKEIDFCRKQISMKEISPEIRSLMNERKNLLANADEAVKSGRFAAAARYFNRIAAISENLEGKEVARTYNRQANYYLEKAKEKRKIKEEKKEEQIQIKPVKKPIAVVTEYEDKERIKATLAQTVKSARNALKDKKPILAQDLYEKAADLAAQIGDKEAEQRYRHKAEEIRILKAPKKPTSEQDLRRSITELMQKAEKALQKKKYREAKEYYEEISERFLQLNDEDAANEYLARANSVRKLIKK
ncbi:MAG: hypothetical protein ACTSRS_19125 [Candidatus Helarchaeota archaeon]